jgi:hypothetical protein
MNDVLYKQLDNGSTVCLTCGVSVIFTDVHNDFHKQLNKDSMSLQEMRNAVWNRK